MPASAALIDPAIASQAVFRTVMDAMADPGGVRPLATSIVPPRPLQPAMAAIVRTLIDYETPVWLDAPLAAAAEVATWIRFETGAAVTRDPRQAAFALIADPLALPAFDTFALGTHDYPDRATTLLIQVDSFASSETFTLTGPGLKAPRRFSAAPLPPDFAARMVANRALFPRGLDLVLVGEQGIAALPRSVTVEGGSA